MPVGCLGLFSKTALVNTDYEYTQLCFFAATSLKCKNWKSRDMFEASLSRCTCKLLSSSKYREQRRGEQGRNEGGVISNAQGFQIEKKVAAGNCKVA